MERYSLARMSGGRRTEDGSASRWRKLVACTSIATALVALLVMAPGAFAAKSVVNSIGTFSNGEGAALFNSPGGVAINENGAGGVPAGTFYVGDKGNRRVEQFGPAGEFVRTWGWGVKDGDEEFEICSSVANCRKGIPGAGAGQFNQSETLGLAVDQATGRVYVSDSENRRINIFSASGLFLGAFGWGVLDFSTELQFCTASTGCTGPQLFEEGHGFGGQFGLTLGGLSISPAGEIYVADSAYQRVDSFKPVVASGTIIGIEFVSAFGADVIAENAGEGFEVCTVSVECKAGAGTSEAGGFGFGSPLDVKVDGEGNIFALDSGNDRIQKFSSAPAPLDAEFGAAGIGSTFGAGELRNLAIDSSTTPNHVLVSGAREGEENHLGVLELDGSGATVELHGAQLTIHSSNGLAVAPASLGGNLYVSSSDASSQEGGNRVLILNEAPVMDPVTVVGGTTATFSGTVVANELQTLYHFEYSTDQVHWTSVPATEVEAEALPGAVPVSQEVTGLTGSQTYFVRLIANRPAGGGKQTSNVVSFSTISAKPAIRGGGASNVGDNAATFNAELNPENQSTSYHFEFGLQDCAVGPCTALPSQEISGGAFVPVATNATGLAPATVYHFRLIATNADGTTEGPDLTVETLPLGAQLPDGRVFELVTPAESNGTFITNLAGPRDNFDWPLISPDGNSVFFNTEGGLPGSEGNGFREAYEAVRGPSGWVSHQVSPNGAQAATPEPGGTSADHSISLWFTGQKGGTLEKNPHEGADVLRRPTGEFELIGRGSEGEDPVVEGRLVTPKGGHVIFNTVSGTAVQLEPNAPPAGTAAIYDRTSDGITHVVSLLPGDGTPLAGEEAFYKGVSEDGSAVVFEIGGVMYVRIGNIETVEVAAGFPTFAGVSEGGGKVFYVLGEELFEFDTATETATQIGSGPETVPVNISADGSHVYFSSPQELVTGSGVAGERNLYVWDGASVEFIATLSQSDFQGFGESFGLVSLSMWTTAIGPEKSALAGRAQDPSRTTPNGDVLVFQSHKVVGYPYDSGGFSEIYRYDAASKDLTCVSCSPTNAPAQSEAELEATGLTVVNAPTNAVSRLYNVTDDGSAVFFTTADSLVPDDTDGVADVYEWKGGRPSLISTGRSASRNYLYSMTSNGSDVLFKTSDSLVPADQDRGSGSIYDARVGGGFGQEVAVPAPCNGEPCQGTPASPPIFPPSGSSVFHGPGNVKNHPKKKHKKKKQKKHKGNSGKKKAQKGRGRTHGDGGSR